jgi:hypothetical protein
MPDSFSSSLMSKIGKYLYTAEMVLTGLLTIGLLLPRLDIDSSLVILISISGLATVFFLQAYNPIPLPFRQDQMGFKELLCFTILPKLMWIATSVCTVGILFFLIDISNGAGQMLLIGATSLVICLVITGYFFLTKQSYVKVLTPVLYRVIPVLLVSAYILLS